MGSTPLRARRSRRRLPPERRPPTRAALPDQGTEPTSDPQCVVEYRQHLVRVLTRARTRRSGETRTLLEVLVLPSPSRRDRFTVTVGGRANSLYAVEALRPSTVAIARHDHRCRGPRRRPVTRSRRAASAPGDRFEGDLHARVGRVWKNLLVETDEIEKSVDRARLAPVGGKTSLRLHPERASGARAER